MIHLPSGKKPLSSKWVLKVKFDHSYKARLVVKGYEQWDGIDYDKTFAPIVNWSTIRVVIALVVALNWKISHMDVVRDGFSEWPSKWNHIHVSTSRLLFTWTWAASVQASTNPIWTQTKPASMVTRDRLLSTLFWMVEKHTGPQSLLLYFLLDLGDHHVVCRWLTHHQKFGWQDWWNQVSTTLAIRDERLGARQ